MPWQRSLGPRTYRPRAVARAGICGPRGGDRGGLQDRPAYPGRGMLVTPRGAEQVHAATSPDGEDDLAEDVAVDHPREAVARSASGRTESTTGSMRACSTRRASCASSSRVPMVEPTTRSCLKKIFVSSAFAGASPEVAPEMTIVPPGRRG